LTAFGIRYSYNFLFTFTYKIGMFSLKVSSQISQSNHNAWSWLLKGISKMSLYEASGGFLRLNGGSCVLAPSIKPNKWQEIANL
jgi:hypothetical protein